jgi:hypothetical protein
MKDMLAGAPPWLGGSLASLVVDCSRRLGLRLWLTVREHGGAHHLMFKGETDGEELIASLRCGDEEEALRRLHELGNWVETWSKRLSAPPAEA